MTASGTSDLDTPIGISDLETDGVALGDEPTQEQTELIIGYSSNETSTMPMVVDSPPELGYILLAVSMIIGCLCALVFIKGTKL